MVTFRQVERGGLGLHCAKTRAMAMLIHMFLFQAICPMFANNQYHQHLYKWHIIEERHFPDPCCPPYKSSTFFNLIKYVKENTSLNVAWVWVTVKQWYQLLLERGVTHTSDNPDTPPVLIIHIRVLFSRVTIIRPFQGLFNLNPTCPP